MKFKEIEPGMVIHCFFNGSEELLQLYLTKNSTQNSTDGEKSTMTAEEVLTWLTQCLTTYDVEKAKAFKRLYDVYEDEWGFTDLVSEYSSKEIIDIITDYKAKKAKKPKPVKYGKVMFFTAECGATEERELWYENEDDYKRVKLLAMAEMAREYGQIVKAEEYDICKVVNG